MNDDRMSKLRMMLEKQPGDTFLLYALALEYKKLHNALEALNYLGQVLAHDPAHCAAWQQTALIHEAAGEVEAAQQAYRKGIAAAAQIGDRHAEQEMSGALAMLE